MRGCSGSGGHHGTAPYPSYELISCGWPQCASGVGVSHQQPPGPGPALQAPSAAENKKIETNKQKNYGALF